MTVMDTTAYADRLDERAGRVVEAVRPEPVPVVPAAPAPRLHPRRRLRRGPRPRLPPRRRRRASTTTPRPCAAAASAASPPSPLDEFAVSPFAVPGRFDALLSAHVDRAPRRRRRRRPAADATSRSCAPAGGCCSSRRRSAASRPTPPTSPSPTTTRLADLCTERRPAGAVAPVVPAPPTGPGAGSSTTSSSSTRRCPPALRVEGPAHPPRLAQRRHAVAHRAEAAAVDVVPHDRHLGHHEAEAVGPGQDLDVEGEAGGDQRAEQRRHHLDAERLQPALRVGQTGEAGRPAGRG